jgi:hypothetical protein
MSGPSRIGSSSPAAHGTPAPATGKATSSGRSIASTPTPGNLSAHASPASSSHVRSTAPRASNAALKNFLAQANHGLQQAPAALNQAADTLQLASTAAQQAGSLVQHASALLPHAPKALQQAGSALQTLSASAQLAASHVLPVAATVASAAGVVQAAQGAVQAFQSPSGAEPGARTGALLNLAAKTGELAVNLASAQPTARLATTLASTAVSTITKPGK